MLSQPDRNFVRQNGYPDADEAVCAYQFPALMFQPRLIAVCVAIGILLQQGWVFGVLSALLWWNVLVPSLNPFDVWYSRRVLAPRGLPRLPPASGPRRFAQAMAAINTLGAAVSLLAGWYAAALAFQGFVVVALTSLLVGRLCLGSYLFHVFWGNVAFGNRTLPWR